MTPKDKLENGCELLELARRKFGHLTESENRLVLAVRHGEVAFCGPNYKDNDPANDPADSADWDSEREIRGVLVRWLFVNQGAKQWVDPRGIQVHGAKISGGLDLSYIKSDFPLKLLRCRVDGLLNIDHVYFSSIMLTGSCIKSISADVARITGSLRLDEGFQTTAEVRLRGAHIGGNLNCQGGIFRICEMDADAHRGIALNAEGARIDGSVLLRRKFSAKGNVRLYRAQIGGNLDCDGGQIAKLESTAPGQVRTALDAESANISGSVLFRDDFSAKGEIRLLSAKIGGFLACDGARLQNPAKEGQPDTGTALQAEGITVSNSVLLWKNFYAEGAIRFFGARVQGSFVCHHTTLKNPVQSNAAGSGTALNAETAEIAGYVHLRDHFFAEGMVRLFRSKIGLGLDCSDGKFENLGGTALDCHGARIGGNVLLGDGFEASGEVSFSGAKVDGYLHCRNAKLRNPWQTDAKRSGIALNADDIKVNGSVALTPHFRAEGAVRFFGAEIGQNFNCEGGEFRNPFHNSANDTGIAFTAEASKITGSLLLRNNFRSHGLVRLYRTVVEGNLECNNATFSNIHEGALQHSNATLDAAGVIVSGNVFLNDATHNGTVKFTGARIAGGLRSNKASFLSLDLRDATAAWIVDDSESWPELGKLLIDGFVYNRISGGPIDVSTRLNWLRRQDSFKRQAYRQLAAVLDAAGDDFGARKIQSEMQRRAWKSRPQITRPFSWLLRFTIGYGYFPLRAVWLLLTLVAVGFFAFSIAYNLGVVVPTNRESYAYFEQQCAPPPYYERFHALAYSMENSFPVVKLGTQEKWAPASTGAVLSCGPNQNSTRIKSIVTPTMVRWLRWVQICCGWILTTLFVGGITGLVRKN